MLRRPSHLASSALRCTVLAALVWIWNEPAFAQSKKGLPTAAVDLESMSTQCFKMTGGLGLENSIVVRLVQEGYAVISKAAAPELLLRLRCTGKTLWIAESRSGFQRTLELNALSRHQLHLTAGQAAVELANRSRASRKTPEIPPPAAPKPTSTQTAPVTVREAARLWRISAGGGGLLRSPKVDPRFVTEVSRQVGPIRPLLLLGWTPSREPDISVTELEALLGVRRELTAWHGLFLDLLWRAGARLHLFQLHDVKVVPDRGARISALMELGVSPGWRLSEQVGLTLDVTGSLCAGAVEHRLDGNVIWTRAIWGVSTTLQLQWNL